MSREPHIPAAKQPLARRLMWFAGLWVAGVLAVGLVAGLVRLALKG